MDNNQIPQMPLNGMPGVNPGMTSGAMNGMAQMPMDATMQAQMMQNSMNGVPGAQMNMTNMANMTGATVSPMNPNLPQATIAGSEKKDPTGLIKTLTIIGLALLVVTFVGLFIWKQMQYTEAREDVDGQIAVAVQDAEAELTEKLEAEFAEREKYPYLSFTGPADYGQLTFKYPRTWSVYVAQDASKGGDFQAYFNPVQVNTVSSGTINALRVTIKDQDFDQVAATYQRYIQDDRYDFSLQSITVGGTTANLYTGQLPNTDELSGYLVIFKIRDKTAMLQTDSVLFHDDFFNVVIDSITFNA